MSEKNASVFVSKCYPRTGKYGQFWSGNVGLMNFLINPKEDGTMIITVTPSKPKDAAPTAAAKPAPVDPNEEDAPF